MQHVSRFSRSQSSCYVFDRHEEPAALKGSKPKRNKSYGAVNSLSEMIPQQIKYLSQNLKIFRNRIFSNFHRFLKNTKVPSQQTDDCICPDLCLYIRFLGLFITFLFIFIYFCCCFVRFFMLQFVCLHFFCLFNWLCAVSSLWICFACGCGIYFSSLRLNSDFQCTRRWIWNVENMFLFFCGSHYWNIWISIWLKPKHA